MDVHDTSIFQQHFNANEELCFTKQGPKYSFLAEFWQIVFQEFNEVAVIVMLTQTVEGGREKCAQYFPVDMGQASMILATETFEENLSDVENSTEEKNIRQEKPERHEGAEIIVPGVNDGQPSQSVDRVTLLECGFDSKSRSEVLKLKLSIGSRSKIVWHFQFAGWADFVKPEGSDREALFELMKLSASKAGPGNPRIVHDSAGVGRTGTFIALDYLARELDSGQLERITDETDPVFETVNRMREQRMMMVYTELQWEFIYEALRERLGIKLGKVFD